MFKLMLFAVLNLFAGFIAMDAFAKSGCCSWHGGVCGAQCCDGTALSAKCGGFGGASSGTQLTNAIDSGQETDANRNYIDDGGNIIRSYRKEGKYPLAYRRWYQTTQGRAATIFLNITDTVLANGPCNGGTAFRGYASGHFSMKCFDYNRTGKIGRRLYFETKARHYLDVGSCDAAKFVPFAPSHCSTPLFRKPTYYDRQGDVGDLITEEECKSIFSATAAYGWDQVCG